MITLVMLLLMVMIKMVMAAVAVMMMPISEAVGWLGRSRLPAQTPPSPKIRTTGHLLPEAKSPKHRTKASVPHPRELD